MCYVYRVTIGSAAGADTVTTPSDSAADAARVALRVLLAPRRCLRVIERLNVETGERVTLKRKAAR